MRLCMRVIPKPLSDCQLRVAKLGTTPYTCLVASASDAGYRAQEPRLVSPSHYSFCLAHNLRQTSQLFNNICDFARTPGYMPSSKHPSLQAPLQEQTLPSSLHKLFTRSPRPLIYRSPSIITPNDANLAVPSSPVKVQMCHSSLRKFYVFS